MKIVEPREQQRAEIHLLAQGLGLVKKDSREEYERALATFFDKTSTTDLTDDEHYQFLRILRSWTRARAIIRDRATAPLVA